MSDQYPDNTLTPAQIFKKYFSVILADTKELKQQVYNIRYRVYCEEFNYETVASCPNTMESDKYDRYALHCLIIHNSSRMPAACVRLVPATSGNVDTELAALDLLPFEKYCTDSLDHDFIEQLNLIRSRQCEISRLAVEKTFRKRSGESLTRFGDINIEVSKEEQRTFLLIAVAAFLAATALTDLSGKTDVFAMMEPFLPRLLKRSGIVFQRAGQDIDYHGIRAPYFITTQSALKTMRPELLALYQWIHQQIAPAYLKLT
ncbi:PEP-CTERM/exosortase system-associated acyltransferase [sulfur-oxidizing endosymbiont of Gigantopelta aegis]|uniref:PEP-CTERM/exosortase system-associated acyltransferase n=1 Tax=sulfur-oxidizing endosymbiont of Gigantopelta aegis TaxID=2794934 RepID=UPI0018DDA136|nr:PEP-CTERM/exosortase system-associated acyltransferase [sulfur-oxidizing endosymbiont of Gigantopelta aegis]